jgi:two-component system, chemotaxis family, chemotaxis protein CheY
MKTLIVEDDLTSRLLLQEFLKEYGPIQIAVDGEGAIGAVRAASEAGEFFDLICLDIMLPEMNGIEVLRQLREREEARGIMHSQGSKILMITALGDIKNVMAAYSHLCDGYLTKPLAKAQFQEELRRLKLIE